MTSHRRPNALLRCAGTENIGGPALELRFPRCDLIGVDLELLRQLSQRSIALDGGKRHLRLEDRCGVPARSFAHKYYNEERPHGAIGQKTPIMLA